MRSVNLHLTSSTGCQHVKHGPKTILLKLLTILLSGSPYQWWTRQQGTAGLIPQQSQLRKLTLHVQLLSRAINVKIVELAGTNQFQMFVMVSIKKFPRGILDQVISSEVRDGARERASWSGPYEVASNKQVTSSKRQASIKLSNQPGQLTSGKHPNHNHKRQATSQKLQAH